MPARTALKFVAFVLFACSQPAYCLIDDYSTGPGAGGADGLDDVWQAVYNGWGLSGAGDEDNDGCSNYVESLAGTNPRLAGDCFKVGNMAISATDVTFFFEAEAGKKYRVLSNTTPGGTFPNVVTQTFPTNGAIQHIPSADSVGATASIKVAKVGTAPMFYKLEVSDIDTDSDGVSDWAERETGTNPNAAASLTNASGGEASDLDTLRSLLSLSATPGNDTAHEKEGTAATVRLQRSVGNMKLTVNLGFAPGTGDATKSNATANDFVFKNMANVATSTVTLPAGEGLGSPVEVAKVAPVLDSTVEVPEMLKVCVNLPGVPAGVPCPTATIKVTDADPANTANRTLYVAFLGREAGVVSTASGYATALVEGDNSKASIGIVFNNLSSQQNTAYIRIGQDQEVKMLPLGQVNGVGWDIRAAQFVSTDQAMLDALRDGQLYVSITTANFPEKEIFGYFNRASGSAIFDENREELVEPTLGSAVWQNPTVDALEREIWRFMSQATLGGTTALYSEIRAKVDAAITGGGTYLDGLEDWLDQQMDAAQTPSLSYRKLVEAADMEEFALRGNKPATYSADPQLNGGSLAVTYVNGMPTTNPGNPNTNDPGNNYPRDAPNRRREWWTMITQSQDHVRQRMAQALSEICVISERDAAVLMWHYGAANWWDMLAAGAFGSYRTLLENVTLNPMMGSYLTSVSNRAYYDAGGGLFISPDENYAREVMQLFSIGLVLRHPDGSLQLSSEGLPIATYDNNDITELARVFTGFSHGARHGEVRVGIEGQYGTQTSSVLRNSPTIYQNGTANNTWFGVSAAHLYWQAPWIYPMKVMGRIGTTVYHDFNTYSYLDNTQSPPVQVQVPGLSKRLLAGKHGQYEIGAWSPVGQTDAATHVRAALEVSQAHDCLAGVAGAATYGDGTQSSPGHTNTPINMSRWLIQRLVTSNPSAGYIYRVQKVWRETNGKLGPVLKAILLDHEARSLQLADSSIAQGKVKEPLIHFASILRQFRAYSGAPVSILRDMNLAFSDTDAPSSSYPASELDKFSLANVNPPSKPTGWGDGPFRLRIDSLRNNLGQSPLDAPSVFNWFYPDFTVQGSLAQNGLVAPELQTVTEGAEMAKINFLYSYMWMTLAHMSATPGASTGVADFIFRNGWATPAVRFSINGGTSFLNWPASITLDASNWNTGVNVTMLGINNTQFSEMASTQVRYAVSGTATEYAGVTALPTPITFVENEVKNEQLVITQSSGNTWVREGGSITDTFSVKLSAPPADDAVIEVTMAPQNGEVSLSSSVLSFNDSNWNTPVSIIVTAVDDGDDENAGTGNDSISFTTTSVSSANYNGIVTAPLFVGVMDNDDSYGVVITETAGSTNVSETSATAISPLSAGMDSYSIVLTKAPTTNVVISINTGVGSQLGVNPTEAIFTAATGNSTTTRTFTPSNWFTAQTVIVRGNNDGTSENSHSGTITHSITTPSPEYPTTMALQSITANITDDDHVILIAHTGDETRVSEGGEVTDTVTVRLRSAPNASVSVTLSSYELKFSPSTLTFNPSGSGLWSSNQTVTVTGNDDYQNEGLHTSIIYAHSQSAGTNYNGSSGGSLPVTIIDNDDARLVVTQSAGSTEVNENGLMDSYTLALGRKPAAGTTVSVSLSGYSGIALSSAGPFVFNESNWNSPQTVMVSTANDATADLAATTTITHSVSSTDPVYNKSSSPVVVVRVMDNEPVLNIVQTSTFTTVKEGGGSGTTGTPNVNDTFTVAPARAPATGASVVVTLVPDGQVTVSPSTLTFTSTTAQTVTVTAVNDLLAEGTVHRGVVGFNIASALDGYYNGAAAPPVLVQVTDNDSPGVSVVESSGLTQTTEGSATGDSFTVVLTQAPTADVNIQVNGGTQSLLSQSGTANLTQVTLNFTPANWATAQTVNVLPVNDLVPELRHLAPITLTVLPGSATAYAALPPLPSVTNIISDDDTGNLVRITESGTTPTTSTTESSATDTFTVVLSQMPDSDVTVTLTPDSQVAASVSTLVFTKTNWNTAQTVTIRAIDDDLLEPVLHWGTVAFASTSADPVFNGVSIPTLSSNITDNDGPHISLLASGGTTVVTESPSSTSSSDTYTVALSHAPSEDVVITATPDAQAQVSPSALTFTPANWSVPQTFTVTAVSDTVAEATSHNGIIDHSVSSADPLYHNLSAARLTVQVWDNDSAGLTIEHAGIDTTSTIVTEGSTDTFVVKLNTPPAPGTSVTITLYPPAYYVPPPQHGKTAGYFVNDAGGSNQRDNIVIDYTESIQKYRSVFYGHLRAAHGGTIPGTPDPAKIQNAHWAASTAVIDQMDLWFSGGSLKASHPVLVVPNQPAPVPLPPINPRQTMIEAIYAHSGGNDLPATTRYEAEIPFNPKSPSTTTFANDVRDRVRWAGYLMTVGAPGLISH